MPQLAAKAHEERLDEAIKSVLEESGLSGIEALDGLALTRGPGLSACLDVGMKKTRELATKYGLETMPINHMEGHLLVPRLEDPSIQFPLIALLVSGGHSQIIAAKNVGEYHLLGETLDIALGDAYDKVARALGISNLNGGRALEERALHGNPSALKLSIPMKKYKNCDFSFSGIQTAIDVEIERLYKLETHQSTDSKLNLKPASSSGGPYFNLPQNVVCDLAASFQRACLEHVIDRMDIALKWCQKTGFDAKTVLVSGGVASNTSLFSALDSRFTPLGFKVVRPKPAFCRDNAVMIGWAAHESLDAGVSPLSPEELNNIRYIPRWPLDSSGTDYFPDSHPSHSSTPVTIYREAALQTHLEALAQQYSPQTVLRVCRAYITNKRLEDAHQLLQEALERFPNDVHLEKLSRKLMPQYQSWRNKYS